MTSMYGHDHYQRDYETELGRPWRTKPPGSTFSPFYRVKNITTPTLFMGAKSTGTFPSSAANRCTRPSSHLGRSTELVVYPGEYHEFKTPSHIKDRLERYLAWYGHYVKGDTTPARPQPASEIWPVVQDLVAVKSLWTDGVSRRTGLSLQLRFGCRRPLVS